MHERHHLAGGITKTRPEQGGDVVSTNRPMTSFPLITADASPTPEDNGSAEGFIAAGAASTAVDCEAFRQARYQDLPSSPSSWLKRPPQG